MGLMRFSFSVNEVGFSIMTFICTALQWGHFPEFLMRFLMVCRASRFPSTPPSRNPASISSCAFLMSAWGRRTREHSLHVPRRTRSRVGTNLRWTTGRASAMYPKWPTHSLILPPQVLHLSPGSMTPSYSMSPLPLEHQLGVDAQALHLVHDELERVANLDEVNLRPLAARDAVGLVPVRVVHRDHPTFLADGDDGAVGVEALLQEERRPVGDEGVLLHLSQAKAALLGALRLR